MWKVSFVAWFLEEKGEYTLEQGLQPVLILYSASKFTQIIAFAYQMANLAHSPLDRGDPAVLWDSPFISVISATTHNTAVSGWLEGGW